MVRRLEAGGTDLEESLALWERGEKLAQICQALARRRRKRLDAALAAERRPTSSRPTSGEPAQRSAAA